MAFTANYLQTVTYAARIDRTLFDNLWTEGILGAGSLLVSERGAGTNMSVDVAAGVAVVEGDDQVFQGKYLCREQAATTGLVITAAPGSGTRHDLVVLRVNDTNAGGPSGDNAVLAVIAGIASATPTDPATPDSALVLARVRVATGTTAITDAMIDDLRVESRSPHDVIPADVVTTAKIADSAVTTAKINNLAVTAAKIANTSITAGKVASNAVETAKINNLAVTEAKLAVAVLSSAWADTPFASGAGAPTDGPRARHKKIGNVVFLNGGVRRASTGSALLTLPAGFRPAIRQVYWIHFSSTAAARIEITTSGAVATTGFSVSADTELFLSVAFDAA